MCEENFALIKRALNFVSIKFAKKFCIYQSTECLLELFFVNDDDDDDDDESIIVSDESSSSTIARVSSFE